MRKIFLPVLLLMSFGVLVVACKKNSSNPPANPTSSFVARMNGNQWSCDQYLNSAISFNDTAHHIQNIAITGAKLLKLGKDTFYTPQVILLNIDSFNGIQNYKFTKTGGTFAEYSLGGRSFKATSGEVEITGTSLNYIQGKFHFVTDSVTITDGVFYTGVK